jgi:hypothetical protein
MNFIFAEKLLLRTPAKSWKYYIDTDRQKMPDEAAFYIFVLRGHFPMTFDRKVNDQPFALRGQRQDWTLD